MEEVKEVRAVEGCSHTCVDVHKFCPKSCCFIKCFLVIVVLGGVFAAGYCAGRHEGNEGYGERGDYRNHHMMMRYDEGADEVSSWDNSADDGSQDVQVIYRTVDQPALQQSMATATPQK